MSAPTSPPTAPEPDPVAVLDEWMKLMLSDLEYWREHMPSAPAREIRERRYAALTTLRDRPTAAQAAARERAVLEACFRWAFDAGGEETAAFYHGATVVGCDAAWARYLACNPTPAADEGWRPIETAPEYSDGLFVVVVGGRYALPQRVPAEGALWRASSGEAWVPTHWLPDPMASLPPLPLPPAGAR